MNVMSPNFNIKQSIHRKNKTSYANKFTILNEVIRASKHSSTNTRTQALTHENTGICTHAHTQADIKLPWT